MPYRSADATTPAFHAVAVTPHDSNNIETTRSLYVGGTGNLHVIMESGAEVTFAAVPVGVFPVQVTRVYSTSTTATSIHALY